MAWLGGSLVINSRRDSSTTGGGGESVPVQGVGMLFSNGLACPQDIMPTTMSALQQAQAGRHAVSMAPCNENPHPRPSSDGFIRLVGHEELVTIFLKLPNFGYMALVIPHCVCVLVHSTKLV